MFYTFGEDYHLANIQKVSGLSADCISLDAIKSAYNQFLSKDSVFNGAVNWNSPIFVNFSDSSRYSQKYFEEKQKYFDANFPEIENLLRSEYFKMIFNEMKLGNPHLFDMAEIFIKVIIINKLKSYTNGTTEDALGLAVIDYKSFFNKIDFHELIFHQVVHMMTYLDDKINPHVPEDLKEYLVTSDLIHKAGGNQFQLYILFHSYLVGVEILLYRLYTNQLSFDGNYHGKTKRIIERCLKGRLMLEDHMEKFTEQGKLILSKTHAHLVTVSDQYLVAEKM